MLEYDAEWLNERTQYLLARGWERDTANTSGVPTFRDPKGSRLGGELRDAVELPNKGDDLNKTIKVQQLHLPPAPFTFTIEEAVSIQRRRDAVGDSGPSPLDRVAVLEKKNNDLQLELDRLKGRLRLLLAAQHQTPASLKLAIREALGEKE